VDRSDVKASAPRGLDRAANTDRVDLDDPHVVAHGESVSTVFRRRCSVSAFCECCGTLTAHAFNADEAARETRVIEPRIHSHLSLWFVAAPSDNTCCLFSPISAAANGLSGSIGFSARAGLLLELLRRPLSTARRTFVATGSGFPLAPADDHRHRTLPPAGHFPRGGTGPKEDIRMVSSSATGGSPHAGAVPLWSVSSAGYIEVMWSSTSGVSARLLRTNGGVPSSGMSWQSRVYDIIRLPPTGRGSSMIHRGLFGQPHPFTGVSVHRHLVANHWRGRHADDCCRQPLTFGPFGLSRPLFFVFPKKGGGGPPFSIRSLANCSTPSASDRQPYSALASNPPRESSTATCSSKGSFQHIRYGDRAFNRRFAGYPAIVRGPLRALTWLSTGIVTDREEADFREFVQPLVNRPKHQTQARSERGL